jgi:hypothetical protein
MKYHQGFEQQGRKFHHNSVAALQFFITLDCLLFHSFDRHALKRNE